ncbi:MAG TPA: DUF998 domain-containing protein [Anaerolineales bacterium]|nr:DUF998 domain-containing protein [Anaerolineales bacterium]
MPAIIIGGCLFFISILIAGHFTPGYSHKQQSISELGISGSVYGLLVRWLGFVPLGLSFILFACQSGGLFTNQFPFVLIILIGLAILCAGIFPTDPDNRRDTISGKIHASAVISLLLLLSAAPFTFSVSAFYNDPPAGWFLNFSLLVGILVLGFFIISSIDMNWLSAVIFQKSRDRIEENWQLLLGMQQRLLLSFHCIWWFVFSLVLTGDGVFHLQISTVHI